MLTTTTAATPFGSGSRIRYRYRMGAIVGFAVAAGQPEDDDILETALTSAP